MLKCGYFTSITFPLVVIHFLGFVFWFWETNIEKKKQKTNDFSVFCSFGFILKKNE